MDLSTAHALLISAVSTGSLSVKIRNDDQGLINTQSIKKPSTRLGFLLTVVTVKITAQRCGKPAEHHHSRQACLRTSGTSQNLLPLPAS